MPRMRQWRGCRDGRARLAFVGTISASRARGSVAWETSAEARLANIPGFIRPMAKRSIERFAEGKGYTTITEAVMDEARTVFGM